jgi:branched-chain amino acid transport system ATP-binding protein
MIDRSGEPFLSVRGLHKSFGRFMALTGVDLDVWPGEVRAVIGPNGAGKSTLMNVLGGQLAGDTGEVHLGQRRLTNRHPHQMAALGVGRTFQISSTFRRLTVYENMLAAHNSASGHWFSLSARRLRALRDAVLADLERIQLAHLANQVVEDISHGDRKRLEFGMVLATQARLLLLDEPTAGMGLHERTDLIELVLREVRQRGLTLVFVEHDIDVVFRAADYITVMALGRVFAQGLPDEIAHNADVQEIYLGGR